MSKLEPKVKAKIGLLPTGLKIYWEQFPSLKEKGLRMYDKLVEKLYPEDTVVRDKSVLSFTPALCASVQAALCVKLLTGRPVETGKLYYFDLLHQEFETIPMLL